MGSLSRRWLVEFGAALLLTLPATGSALATGPIEPTLRVDGLSHAPASAPALALDSETLGAGLRSLNANAALAQTALLHNDLYAARTAYVRADRSWEMVEEGVRERSRAFYRSIDDALYEVDRALQLTPIDVATAVMLLTELQTRVEAFLITLPSATTDLDNSHASPVQAAVISAR